MDLKTETIPMQKHKAPPEPEHHPLHVDLKKPESWVKHLREFIEPMEASEAEDWMGHFRGAVMLAGRIVRDQVYARRSGKCFVCGRALKDGKPAGVAGYYDAEREYIHVYYCDQSETTKAFEMVKSKEDDIEQFRLETEQVARDAAVAARNRRIAAQ